MPDIEAITKTLNELKETIKELKEKGVKSSDGKESK